MFRVISRVLKGFIPIMLVLFLLTGCSIPVYHQTSLAEAKAGEIKETFDKTDETLLEAKDISEKVYDDALVSKIMEGNLEDIVGFEESFYAGKGELENVSGKIDEMNAMRLPSSYKNGYVANLTKAYDARIAAFENAEALLSNSKDLASALVGYDSGINRMTQIGDKLPIVLEIEVSDLESAKALEKETVAIVKDGKICESEFSNAGIAVDVPVFQELSESAHDVREVIAAADSIAFSSTGLLESLEKEDSWGILEYSMQIPVFKEMLVEAMVDYVENFPVDLVDENNDLTTKAQNQIEDWKSEHMAPLFVTFDEKQKEIENTGLQI
ncbi:hypothetical protein KKH43_01645 [Patescibacteria group bacterium]|nr:hypothetical protein [Patescibacteria group bacterium]